MMLGVFALFNLTSCAHKTELKAEAGKYTITSPIVLDTTYIKEYVAQIQSIQNVEIRAQVKGYLDAIHVDEGQFVKPGQALFNIMPKVYEAEYQKARAHAQMEELELQNVKTLAEKEIVSITEQAIAQAKVDEANAELSLAGLDVAFTQINAPFEGTIDRLRFKKGSLIDEGTVLTSISNNREVFAYFNLTEVEYLDYKNRTANDKKNTVALIIANGNEHKYKGVIETVESEFDNNTGNIAFRARFPNPDLLLKHGETGKVQMTMSLKNALIIPQKATYEIQDKIYVYVVGDDDVIKSRNIMVKQKLPNLYVLESGLSENDKILLDGIQSANDGDKVETQFIPGRQVIDNLQLIKQ